MRKASLIAVVLMLAGCTTVAHFDKSKMVMINGYNFVPATPQTAVFLGNDRYRLLGPEKSIWISMSEIKDAQAEITGGAEYWDIGFRVFVKGC